MVRFWTTLVIAFLGIVGYSQTLTIDIQRDTIATDSVFSITYTLDDGCSFDQLQFEDFHVVMGPNISRSMQYINGKMSKKSSVSYLLKPKESGVFYLPNEACFVRSKEESMIVVLDGYQTAQDREKRILSTRKIKKI